MTDAEVLDTDLTNDDRAYTLFVLEARDVERVVRGWYRRAHGRDPLLHDVHHAYWRIIAERLHWKTLRNGLQTTWPVEGPSLPPDPGPPPPPVDPGPVGPPTGPPSTAGFLEHAGSVAIRPRPSRSEIAGWLPSRPGPFQFPAPYHTFGVRVTSDADGQVHPLGMSYWPAINAHGAFPTLFVLVSLNEQLAVLEVDKTTGAVSFVQALPFQGTGEGAYWSLSHPTILYVPSNGRLVFYDIATGQSGDAAASGAGPISHCHSSYDGQSHSFELNGGAAVSWQGDIIPFPSPYGGFDECQISKSSEYLLIRELQEDKRQGNRIIRLRTRESWVITDAGLAVGHCDTGWDCVVGEEDQSNPGGVFRRWDFTPNGPVDAGMMYAMDWTSMTRYASYCHARPGDPRSQVALYSSSHEQDHPRANEIVTAPLDGSLQCRVICPNLADLTAPGDPYWLKTRAAICPEGEWAAWWGNAHGRGDLFLARL